MTEKKLTLGDIRSLTDLIYMVDRYRIAVPGAVRAMPHKTVDELVAKAVLYATDKAVIDKAELNSTLRELIKEAKEALCP